MNAALDDASTIPDAGHARALHAVLRDIGRRYQRPALASSLSLEDMTITHAIAASGAPIEVFVIDTGRLHAETLALIDRTRQALGVELHVVRPEPQAVDAYVQAHGDNGFYESIELRQRCCQIRKVEPLSRALAGRDAWLTGQRRAHGPERAGLAVEERDEGRGIAKFNPLAAWSDDALRAYVERHRVPYNPLHDRGYPSIGCEPCTRAVRPGEPARAGRWWWESRGAKKECGLHLPQVIDSGDANVRGA
jgi:phosphoadenosine phosphosulfate reductase